AHHAEVDQRIQQPVDRRQRQIDIGGDMAERRRSGGVRDALEQPEGTLDGLDSALRLADRGSLRVLAAHRCSFFQICVSAVKLPFSLVSKWKKVSRLRCFD